MNLIDLITIREMQPADLNFILDSSITSLSKYRTTLFKGWTNKDISSYLETLFLHALSNKRYSTFLVVSSSNPDEIFSYIIADTEENHIFYNYTKYDYRSFELDRLYLWPLVLDPKQPITLNFQTSEALRLQRNGVVSIINKYQINMILDHYIQKEIR